MIRECEFYDGIRDWHLVRHDVLCVVHGQLHQFGVTHILTQAKPLEYARRSARCVLGRHLGHCELGFFGQPTGTILNDGLILPFSFSGRAYRPRTDALASVSRDISRRGKS